MSKWLIGSVTSRIPSRLHSAAAWRRLATIVRRAVAGSTVSGAVRRGSSPARSPLHAHIQWPGNAIAEFSLAARQAGEPPLTLVPVTRWQVEERLRQPIGL